jgi:hypothetical protein
VAALAIVLLTVAASAAGGIVGVATTRELDDHATTLNAALGLILGAYVGAAAGAIICT